MTKDGKALRTFVVALTGIGLAVAAAAAVAQGLVEAARSAADDAASAFSVRPQKLFDSSPDVSSRPDTGVHIGEAGLREILSKVPKSAATAAVDFVVAHEMWHQRQFSLYGATILDSSGDASRVYECQADLLAASFTMKRRGARFSEADALAQSVRELSYALGMQSHLGGTHPLAEQRRTAVRLGLVKGALDGDLPRSAGLDTDTVEHLRRNLDLKHDEDDATWSLRQCKRIVHFSDEGIRRLAVEQESVNFNKDPQAPFVTYSLLYRNEGDVPLRVSTSIQLLLSPRTAPTDVGARLAFASDNFVFDVAPGASHRLQGVLPWYGDQQYFPRIVFSPRDPQGLVSAEVMEFTAALVTCADSTVTDLPPLSERLRRVLVPLAVGAGTDFAGFTAGTADADDEDLTYESKVEIPNADYTNIVQHKQGGASVLAQLFRGADSNAAQQVFTRYRDALIGLCPDKSQAIETYTGRNSTALRIRYSTRTRLELTLWSAPNRQNYNVDFELKTTAPQR